MGLKLRSLHNNLGYIKLGYNKHGFNKLGYYKFGNNRFKMCFNGQCFCYFLWQSSNFDWKNNWWRVKYIKFEFAMLIIWFWLEVWLEIVLKLINKWQRVLKYLWFFYCYFHSLTVIEKTNDKELINQFEFLCVKHHRILQNVKCD